MVLVSTPPAADRALAAAARRPRLVVIAAVAIATLVGWAALLALAPAPPPAAAAAGLPAEIARALTLLCTPAGGTGLSYAAAFAMWAAMALAMMTPTAAPMLATYADIAEVARAKGEPQPGVLVLGAGYLAVWLGFAAVAAAVQVGLAVTGLAADLPGSLAAFLGAAALIGAGLYQFSPLKHACLSRCRSPMRAFFARWSDRPLGVARLGLDQGLACLGCCWALMTLMLVAGAANLAWMAVLGLAMLVEKTSRGRWAPRLVGLALIGWGLALAAIEALHLLAGA